MVTLDAILASLARIEQEQSAVHETIINRHVGSTEQLKRLEAGQMNILAAQDKIWQLVGAVHTHLADLHVKLDNHDAWARDFDGVEEANFNARANAWENVLRELNTKLDAGLRGVSDGCGLAIAELRKELLGTPQRGRKHSYRNKKSSKR